MAENKQENDAMELPVSGELMEPYAADLGPIGKSDIDIQVATAQRYPRNVTTFLRETKDLACLDKDTAASMFYSIPRAGKNIVGPSIRLAELIASTWGNIRVECRIVEQSKKSVTVEAACWDVQRNTAVKVPKTRKIQGKKAPDGTQLPPSDDMINLATNSAISVALRDAIFRVVPRTYVNEIWKAAANIALGKGKSTKDRRNDLIEFSKKYGISEPRLLAACNANGIDDIGEDELIELRGLFTAIQDGAAIEDCFPDPEVKKSSSAEAKEKAKLEIEKKKKEAEKTDKPADKPKEKEKKTEEVPTKSASDTPKVEEKAKPEVVNDPVPQNDGKAGDDKSPEPASDRPTWYANWITIIDKLDKEGGWTKPFGDLVALHNLNDGEEAVYSETLIEMLVERLGVILKSKSQAAIILATVEKSKLSDELKATILEQVKGFQAKL